MTDQDREIQIEQSFEVFCDETMPMSFRVLAYNKMIALCRKRSRPQIFKMEQEMGLEMV